MHRTRERSVPRTLTGNAEPVKEPSEEPPNAAHAPKGAVWRIQSARGLRATCGGIASFSNDAAPMLPRSPPDARRDAAMRRGRASKGELASQRALGASPGWGSFFTNPAKPAMPPGVGEACQSWSLLNGRLADSTQNTAGAAKSVFNRPWRLPKWLTHAQRSSRLFPGPEGCTKHSPRRGPIPPRISPCAGRTTLYKVVKQISLPRS
jgi:hypothetical protein